MTFLQMYLLAGISIWLLPFFVDRGMPMQWRKFSFAYRVLLTVLVIALWPIALAALLHALYKIVRAYLRFRRVVRTAIFEKLDDIAREIRAEQAEAAKTEAAAAKPART